MLVKEFGSKGVDTRSNHNSTPLNVACEYGHLEVARFLLLECHSKSLDVADNDCLCLAFVHKFVT